MQGKGLWGHKILVPQAIDEETQGFEHRQGSGYVSKKKLTQADIINLLDVMNTELPWMSDCVTKIDATNIGAQHDLKDLLRNIAVASGEDMLSPEEV